jgi:hypothetical protein
MQETGHAGRAQLRHRHVNCGEVRVDEFQPWNVIEAGDRDVLGNTKALPSQLRQGPKRHRVAGDENGGRRAIGKEAGHRRGATCGGEIGSHYMRLAACVLHRICVTKLAFTARSKRRWSADHRDADMTKREEVFGDQARPIPVVWQLRRPPFSPRRKGDDRAAVI